MVRVIPKTLKMVLDTSLLNAQRYKVRIKGKVEQSRERSSAFRYTLVWQLLKREPSCRPRLQSPTLHIYIYIYIYNVCVCVCVCEYLQSQKKSTEVSPKLYLFFVLPPDKYGTRPFLKWVRTQGRSPHASGKIPKYLRPRRHSPIGGRPKRQETKQQTTGKSIIKRNGSSEHFWLKEVWAKLHFID